MKILVVHRQKDVVQVIRSVLTKNDPSIRYYESGLDGLLAARVEAFDLIICGTDLPVITGYELVRAIRMASVNIKTPVVFLADEINDKAKNLSHSLGVAAMLEPQKMDNSLAVLIENALRNAS